MTTNVSPISIVNTLQEEIEAVKSDKKLDIEKRVKLISMLCSQQLRAGALHVSYLRTVARLPQDSAVAVLQMSQLEEPRAGATGH